MKGMDENAEWLEADGLGGFASGTVSGIRTRRYHALLLAATTPPTGRMVLVNGMDVWLDTPGGTFALSSQKYAPGVVHPDGAARIVSFTHDPWPSWEFEAADGTRIRHEVIVPHESASTILTWEVIEASGPVSLRMRPFLSGRDYHSLHHENGSFRFDADPRTDAPAHRPISFAPYPGVPGVEFLTDAEYRHAPDWYRKFLYDAERERGLDDTEDLASPGEFVWQLGGAGSKAVCILRVAGGVRLPPDEERGVHETAAALMAEENARRTALGDGLARSADAYLVRRRGGKTVVAGYPWFTDWGRDTFIAIRGLCLATGRLREACDILREWSDAVSEGMLPNRFPDGGEAPEFNAVDASLWYVVAAHELLQRAGEQAKAAASTRVSKEDERMLRQAVAAIVEGYAAGTRFGIRLDEDGLLAAGVPGLQLTWMDARVGERVITPRIGKPVEIQALWLNALLIAGAADSRWQQVFERGRVAFARRFWVDEGGYLADVVDVDHVAGTRDAAFRPNQIFAAGGLPFAIIDGPCAKRVVDAVERRLVTPMGLRSLAHDEPGYTSHYEGGPSRRDEAYHQGTVWPWLIGPFVEAWLRVHGDSRAMRTEARRRFLAPLLEHVERAGLGHVSEIADAEPPFTPRGCPFQAWSLGEVIRLDRVILRP